MGKTRNLKINFDYLNSLIFDAINYKKPSDRVANIELNLKQKNKDTLINQLIYSEGNNKMIIEGISLQNNKFDSLKKITVKTNKDGKTNNDFIIDYGKKILIKGKHFDANQLSKLFSQKSEGTYFNKINKDIEIDFANIFSSI